MLRCLWEFFFGKACRHEWKVLVQQSHPSAAQEMVRLNVRLTDVHGSSPEDLFWQSCTAVVCCSKCGKIKRIVL